MFVFARWGFEIFYRTHILLAAAIAVFGPLHVPSVKIMYLSGIVWALDLVVRLTVILYVNNRGAMKKVALVRLPADVVRLTFKRDNF